MIPDVHCSLEITDHVHGNDLWTDHRVHVIHWKGGWLGEAKGLASKHTARALSQTLDLHPRAPMASFALLKFTALRTSSRTLQHLLLLLSPPPIP